MPTVEEVVKELRGYGLDVSPQGAHHKVRDPNSGAWLFDISKTPSDHNWYWGLRRHLRRIGIIDKEITELRKNKQRRKNKHSIIDLGALRVAQIQAEAAGERIPLLSDIEDSTEFFTRIKLNPGISQFPADSEEEVIELMVARADAPRLNYTKQRLAKFLEERTPQLEQQMRERKIAAGESLKGVHGGGITEFIRIAIEEVAPARKLRAWKSVASGQQTFITLRNNPDAGMTIWVMNLLEATMDHIEGLKWSETIHKPEPKKLTTPEPEPKKLVKEPEPEPLVVSEREGLRERYASVLLQMLENGTHGDGLEMVLKRLDKLVGLA